MLSQASVIGGTKLDGQALCGSSCVPRIILGEIHIISLWIKVSKVNKPTPEVVTSGSHYVENWAFLGHDSTRLV